MYEREKIKDKETKSYLFREKNHLDNVKKATYDYVPFYELKCNDKHLNYKNFIDKIVLGSIIVKKIGIAYAIEEYSRGVEHFYYGGDLTGKNIIEIKSAIAFMNERLRSAMDRALNDYVSSIYMLDIHSEKLKYGILLKVEPLMPIMSSKLMITFHRINPEYSESKFQYPKYDVLYLNDINQNEKTPAINVEKRSKEYKKNKILKALTKRECEIVHLILEGNTNKYISIKLSITEGTVKKTIHNIYKKLNISSRVELTRCLLND